MKTLTTLKIPMNIKSILIIMMFFISSTFYGQLAMGIENEMSVVKTEKDTDLQWGPCPSFMPEGCNIAVLHGDPAKPNLDVFFKVPANYDIPNHWHTSAERMVLISGELHVTYEGEATKIMKVGSYAFGPSKKAHTAKCGDQGPCVLFIAFEEPLDAFPFVPKE
jgi:quercetin dioxygenase-like cupin family protein